MNQVSSAKSYNAKKIREIKAVLLKAGFTKRPGKGSHSIWIHKKMPDLPITIAGKDGDDAKIYLEKQVKQRLKKLEELQ